MKNTLSIFLLLLLAFAGACERRELPSEHEREAVLQEIYSVKSMFRLLTPDNSGKNLAYLQAVENGRRLFVVNLQSGAVKAIPTTNEVIQIFGWSPDDRYLPYSEVSPELLPKARTSGSFLNETWVSVYDTTTGQSERLTTNSAAIEGSVAWLGTNTCYFSVSPIGKDYSQKFVLDLKTKTRRQVYNSVSDFVLVASNLGAVISKGNICVSELTADKYPKPVYVSNFETNAFDSLQWLRFDSGSGNYYFCARPGSSDERFLFRFNPVTQELKQLTHKDTYNGQLLRAGIGYAYVGNVSNHFYLAIRSPQVGDETNLFKGGGVINYTTAPGRNRLYVTAALGMEPLGIWEYDLDTKRLRQLISGAPANFDTNKVILPIESRYKSANGVEVPYFVVSPANSQTGRKYPVMVYLPPSTWQFQKVFDLQSQLFARLGFHYVAVNYRGCDGYGRDYASLNHPKAAAEDVLGILKSLAANNKSFDLKNVFLCSQSSGEELVNNLIADQSWSWRGAVLDHPSGFANAERFKPDLLPPMILISGDQDRFLPGLQNFVAWAKTNDSTANLLVQTNTGHLDWKVTDNLNTEREVLKFVFQNMK